MENSDNNTLQTRIARLSDYQIIDMVLDAAHHTDEAIEVALREVTRRGLEEKILMVSEELNYHAEADRREMVQRFWRDGLVSQYIVPDDVSEVEKFEEWMEANNLRAHKFYLDSIANPCYEYYIAVDDLKAAGVYSEETERFVIHENPEEDGEDLTPPELQFDEKEYEAWKSEWTSKEGKSDKLFIKGMLIFFSLLIAAVIYLLLIQ